MKGRLKLKKIVLITLLVLTILLSGCATPAPAPAPAPEPVEDVWLTNWDRQKLERAEKMAKLDDDIDAMETIMFGERESEKMMAMSCIHTQSLIEGEDIRLERKGFTHMLSFAYDYRGIYILEVRTESYERHSKLGTEGDFLMSNRHEAKWAQLDGEELFIRDEREKKTMIVEPFYRTKGTTKYHSTVSLFTDEDYRANRVFFCQFSAD
jgi:hypothetical protein